MFITLKSVIVIFIVGWKDLDVDTLMFFKYYS